MQGVEKEMVSMPKTLSKIIKNQNLQQIQEQLQQNQIYEKLT
jgi:hypothetical protein